MSHRDAHARPYDWIDRPRLLARIGSIQERTLARLTLVVAPAGYGKSVVALQWIDSLRGSAVVVYHDFGAVNARQARQERQDGTGAVDERLRDILMAYETDGDVDPLLLKDMLQEVRASSLPVVLILDNADALNQATVSKILDELLVASGGPRSLYCMVLGCREIRPPARLFATPGGVARIGRGHLALTSDELDTYLARAEVSPLDADGHARILERTGGWFEGIRFMAHALQASHGIGWSAALDDYVSMTMLDPLPPATRDLLIEAGRVPTLTDDLWTALATATARDILPLGGVLEIVPSTRIPSPVASPPMFGIVPLVRESLGRLARQGSASLDGDRVAAVAMRWLLDHRMGQAMVAYAQETGRWEQLFLLLEPICREYAIRDNHEVLISLLAPVPAEILVTQEHLAFWYLVSQLPFGRVDRAEPLVAPYLERWGQRDDDPLVGGRALLVQALYQTATGELATAFGFLTRALDLLPAEAHHERMRAATSLLFAMARTGMRTQELEVERIARIERNSLPHDQYWWATFVLPALANRSALRGNLRDAAELLSFHLQTNELNRADSRALYLLRLALIDLERNEIQQATARLAQIDANPEGAYWQSGLSWVEAKICHALGDDIRAFNLLYDAIRQINRHPGSRLLAPRFSASLAQFWIDSSRFDLAEEWVADASFVPNAWPLWFGDVVPGAVLAHLHIVRERWTEALEVLNALIAEGEYLGHYGPLVHIYALKGLVLSLMGARIESQVAIRTAMHLGESQGFHLSFFVGALDTRELLKGRDKSIAIPLLLGATPSPGVTLTGREIEILRLVEQGLTNGEIAEQLYISAFTVKNHLTRIYQRLSVNRRQDALDAARALHIL